MLHWNSKTIRIARILLAAALLLSGCRTAAVPQPPQASAPTASGAPAEALPTHSPAQPSADAPAPASGPLAEQVSLERMFSYLEKLTSIEPYTGWRSAGSKGEKEAQDYISETLSGMSALMKGGLEIERESFEVPVAVDFHANGVKMSAGGQTADIRAQSPRGNRDFVELAVRMDSDGKLNDSQSSPKVVEGTPLVILDQQQLASLTAETVKDKILLVDYALVDANIQGQTAGRNAYQLYETAPAGIVFVTHYANAAHESHGTFAGDGGVLNNLQVPPVPNLFVKLEDLSGLGLSSLADLSKVDSLQMTWDVDVLAPGTSGNLIARIPGMDSSRAMILSAHIDSPNNPGANDDGSGSAILLETASIINEAGIKPPVDLYLVWFGSEELALNGSTHFANTHSELLDRAMGMLELDCLATPVETIHPKLTLEYYPTLSGGVDSWAAAVQNAAREMEIDTVTQQAVYVSSDNSSATGFNVPAINLIYTNDAEMDPLGGAWFAGHFHDPYDTVEIAKISSEVFKQMAQIAVSAALELPAQAADYHYAPQGQKRVVFIASHTEADHMTPAAMREFGLALATAGFDVDVIPFGQPVTAEALKGTSLVIALPVYDYLQVSGDPAQNAKYGLNSYSGPVDKGWSEDEIKTVQDYVDAGGKLVITNSASRLKYTNAGVDPNEDYLAINALSQVFGVKFLNELMPGDGSQQIKSGELVNGVKGLALGQNTHVPFGMASGEALATVNGRNLIAQVDERVLVIGDLGLFYQDNGRVTNLPLWKNIAAWASQ